MPQSKPKGLGPYDQFCPSCWKHGELRIFKSTAELLDHMKHHFFAVAPFRILAIAR